MPRRPIPRPTPFWAKKQASHFRDAFSKAFHAPLVVQLWHDTVALLHDARTRYREELPDPDPEGKAFFLGVRLLAQRLLAESAALAHAYTPDFLERWLLAALAYAATGDPWPLSWPQHIWHFLPDNPITFTADGHVDSASLLLAERPHFLQLADYITSLCPAAPRGRPRKSPTPPRATPHHRIDPTAAAKAYQMHTDGVAWQKIAKELLPALSLYDARQKEQARSRVSRLIERGRLLASTQILSPQKVVR